MNRVRVIPNLLIKEKGLYKGVKFRNHSYVGDPVNAVRIFNEKEVDELSLIDISATPRRLEPNFELIIKCCSEAFMPVSYGGGISSLLHAEKLFYGGVEKIILNTAAIDNPKLISLISSKFGSQSVAVSVDVKKTIFGRYLIYSHCGTKMHFSKLKDYVIGLENRGAGEIILTNINREGTYTGYDFDLLKYVSEIVSIPVIINGGAGNIEHFRHAIKTGANGVGASSMFLFQRPLNGVLISYIDSDLKKSLKSINIQ